MEVCPTNTEENVEKLTTNTTSKKFTYFQSLSLFFVAHCGQFRLQIATVFQLNKILSYPFPLIIDYFRISYSVLCFHAVLAQICYKLLFSYALGNMQLPRSI